MHDRFSFHSIKKFERKTNRPSPTSLYYNPSVVTVTSTHPQFTHPETLSKRQEKYKRELARAFIYPSTESLVLAWQAERNPGVALVGQSYRVPNFFLRKDDQT